MANLLFWMVAPCAILLFPPAVEMARARRRFRNNSRHALHPRQALDGVSSGGVSPGGVSSGGVSDALLRSLPLCLQLLFLAYPTVSTVAFRAFDCEDFGEGGKWMRADYSIDCDGAAYRRIAAVATIAICLFPVGVPVCYAVLLVRARHAIRLERPTPLSSALDFLHGYYVPKFFWWAEGVVRWDEGVVSTRLGSTRPGGLRG